MRESTANTPDKVALVTGGATRVGLSITLALARAGFQTAIHYHSSENPARELASLLEKMGRKHTLIEGDLTEIATPQKIVEQTLKELGSLHVLVNNAAILVPDSAGAVDLAKMKILNVDAITRCIEAATPTLKQTLGSIINIADVAGISPYKKHRAYSRTQSALLDLTRKKALELAPHEVNVNAICPGTVLPPTHYSEETVERLVRGIPMGRIGRPDDVAQATVFLALAPYVTGQILAVDGGYSLGKSVPTP